MCSVLDFRALANLSVLVVWDARRAELARAAREYAADASDAAKQSTWNDYSYLSYCFLVVNKKTGYG